MYSQYPAGCDQATQQLLTDGAKLSKMAYSDPGAIEKSPESYEILKRVQGKPQFITCPQCDAQCYLVKYKSLAFPAGVLAICVRGTTSLEDWLCDAEADQVPFKDVNQKVNGKVHAGFYRQFVALFSKFNDQVKQHLTNGGTLLCVGHSLGSTSSAIAAVNYALGYPGKVWYAGFGTPRVFDATLAKAFDSTVQGKWRLKHGADPVNSVPPPLNYVHAGNEVHLGKKDNYPDVPVLIDVGDHDIAKYVAALENPKAEATETKSIATRNWIQQLLKV